MGRMLRPKVLSACWMCSVGRVYYSGCVPLLSWVNFDVVSHVCCGYRVWCTVGACLASYHLLHVKGDAGGVSFAVGGSFVAWGYL